MLKTSLRYFGAVVQHGSFRAAAEELHVAQSAVSRQIQGLERELGTPLLERRARGVSPTQAGELLFRHIRDMTYGSERLRSEIDALNGLRRGHVRLASIESVLAHVLSPAIDRFLTRHPGITMFVHCTSSDRVVQMLRTGQVEIGVAFNQPRSPDLSVAFSVQEPVFAVLRSDHPLARARALDLPRLAGWPMALSPRPTGTRVLLDAAAAAAGVELSAALETNSIELQHRFALSGQGVAFLAPLACRESLDNGTLRAIPLTGPALTNRQIDVLSLATRRVPIAAEEFLAHLQQQLRAATEPTGVRAKRGRHAKSVGR